MCLDFRYLKHQTHQGNKINEVQPIQIVNSYLNRKLKERFKKKVKNRNRLHAFNLNFPFHV